MRRETKWKAQKIIEFAQTRGLVWTGTFKELCHNLDRVMEELGL